MTTHHPTAHTRTTVDTGTLWSSVDALTRDTKERVERSMEDKRVIGFDYAEVPCLWSQMEDALASDSAGGGGGKASSGSRAPIDVGMASLMADIATQVARALVASGIPPRYLDDVVVRPRMLRPVVLGRHPAPTDEDVADGAEPGLGAPIMTPDRAAHLLEKTQRAIADVVARAGSGRRTRDTRSNLRALAAHLSTGTTPQDVVDEWVETYRRWVAQAETALALEVHEHATVRLPVRDTACEHCGATVVVREEEDGTYREPALLATFRDGQLLEVACRSCGK